ncbi:Uncharacterized protein APZ42_032919 [Daphnia magna]|uniref:Reverse transcriptase/retrotransposon-derived protein RNase H-like domain-containing protein n=1 Tax=Daphnia magna TaxID=35525 RepID=A0A164LJK7_9CRUS|nr:Uncharacterized protein APZ42_032919 [Daphnia magna]
MRFGQDCCANCEPTRILRQLIAGVADNAVRIKMLEQGDALILDQALTILRTAEATQSQAASLQTAAINAIRRSAYKTGKAEETMGKHTHHFAKVCEGTARPIGAIYIHNLSTSGVSELVELSIAPSGQAARDGTVIIQALPDTGSALDAIPHSTYTTLFKHIQLQPGKSAKTVIGNPIHCFGVFTAKINWTGDGGTPPPVTTSIHVLENLQQAVIISATQQKMGMLHGGYENGIRFCPDYHPLNKWLIGAKLPPMRVGRRFDGPHHPEGLHQYTRLPMGISHARDDYGRRFSDIFGHIPNTARCMEDLIVYSSTYDEHINLLRLLFQTASDNNVSFNRKKTVFATHSVVFAGYVVSENGFCPNPELTRAIREFPRPGNITDLRSFFGLCQQVGNFSIKLAATLAPLSPMLKKNIAWEWTPEHELSFKAARTELAVMPELAFYDPNRPTTLFTDASLVNGLGFILKQCATAWQMVQAGSRFLRPAETRYAMIERRILCVTGSISLAYNLMTLLITDNKVGESLKSDRKLTKSQNLKLSNQKVACLQKGGRPKPVKFKLYAQHKLQLFTDYVPISLSSKSDLLARKIGSMSNFSTRCHFIFFH